MIKYAAIAAILLTTTPAHAEIQCATHDQAVASLDAKYGERQVVRGLDDRGVMIEIFASPKGTWTMVIVRPDMTTCVLATGVGFMAIAPGELG